MPIRPRVRTRVARSIFALLPLLAMGLTGCRQASCVWQNTRDAVVAEMPHACCPDACGNVYAEPVYASCCGGDNGVGTGGTGAFARR